MKYAIIADVAGQFKALMRLVDKIPRDYEIIFLGDLIDRGPDSVKVVEFVKSNKFRALYANHEDMMVSGYTGISVYSQLWMMNGGAATVRSYEKYHVLALEHIEWMKTLPRVIKLPLKEKIGSFNEVILTHGTLHSKYTDDFLESEIEKDVKDHFEIERSVIWCRREPIKRRFLQISGHNSHWGYRTFKDKDGEIYSYSIDQSQDHKLTALLIPSMKLVEEDYED